VVVVFVAIGLSYLMHMKERRKQGMDKMEGNRSIPKVRTLSLVDKLESAKALIANER